MGGGDGRCRREVEMGDIISHHSIWLLLLMGVEKGVEMRVENG